MKYTVEKISEDFKCPYVKIGKDGEEIMRIPVTLIDDLKPVMGSNDAVLCELVFLIMNQLNESE